MNSNHYFTELHFCQSTPLAYMITFVIAVTLVYKLFDEDTLLQYGFGMYRKMIHVEEGLPRFKDGLKTKFLNRL